MIELLNKKCRLRHMGDGIYVCKKTMHCPKINDENYQKFNAECFKVIK